MLSVSSHCTRIREVVHQFAAARSDVPIHVTNSWIRCSEDYKLDPARPRELHIVERQELLDRQAQSADVLVAAKNEMASLFQQIAKSDYAIMLTDADGVLLNYFGDASLTHATSRSGFVPGAVWSERFQGTNGMGTCLQVRRPLLIHRDDHYFFRNTGLTCAAAPILDWHGKILAVLDASGRANQDPVHVLDLVNMSVLEIENRIFISTHAKFRLLFIHPRPEFARTLYKGILAIDQNCRVVAGSRNAMAMLGMEIDDIVGRPIDDIFNLSFESLLRSSQKNSTTETPVMTFDVRHGRCFFVLAVSDTKIDKQHTPMLHALAPSAPASMSSNAVIDQSVRTPLEQLQYGPDAAMTYHIATAQRVVERDVAILLCGETGTGKELFAKAIHLSSTRADRPFIAINCASIPESLIESELFGYKAGAFTGASKEGQRGKLLQANGGTLFLDEIGDMPLALQGRLLRVLEEREVTPLGSEMPIKLDIHLISATHCDLQNKIANHTFREDLYYRIQGVTLTLPPLRERADRRALIQAIINQELPPDAIVELDDALMEALERHRWPGNIRQLRNMLRTMLAVRNSDVLTVDNLPSDFSTGVPVAPPTAPTLIPTSVLNPLESAEREALIQELKTARWNLSKVAAQLKLSRNTLYRKLERLDIKIALRDQY